MSEPVQLRAAPVAGVRRIGAYTALSVTAPQVAGAARPGQFVAFAVGGPDSPYLLRRAFSLAGWDGERFEVVLAAVGPGTRWLAARRRGDPVDVLGPLGRPFPMPGSARPCLLVGGGYGAAPLGRLAEELRAAGCESHAVLGAATADRLLGVDEIKAETLTVTTDDGSAGRPGRVSDALPEALERTGAAEVYACGPMPMLAAVAGLAAAYGVPSHVAVEERMACGVGVCMTCVLPVADAAGRVRLRRSCVDGPVFSGAQVRFAEVDQ